MLDVRGRAVGSAVECPACGASVVVPDTAETQGAPMVVPVGGYSGVQAGDVYYDPTRPSGTATAAIVCGILGLFYWPAAICAIIVGIREKRRIDQGISSAAGRGRAQAGYVLGIICVAFFVFMFLLQILVTIASAL
jgi:hypothetical protein